MTFMTNKITNRPEARLKERLSHIVKRRQVTCQAASKGTTETKKWFSEYNCFSDFNCWHNTCADSPKIT